MRYLLLAVSFGAVLFAQEAPAPQALRPRIVVVPAQPAQKEDSGEATDKLELQYPRSQQPAKPPPDVTKVKVRVTLAPGKPCAIPLKEVVRQDAWKIDPKIVMQPRTSGLVRGFIREVTPPAPSCEEVKR